MLVASACQPPVTWSEDAAPFFERYCTRCHSDVGVGPFSFDSHQGVASVLPKVGEALESRDMPPWLPGPGCRDLVGAEGMRPTDEELDGIRRWLELGAPEGKEGVTAGVPTLPVLEHVSVTLTASYDPAGHSWHTHDDLRCHKLPLGLTERRHLVGFDVRPSTPKRLVSATLVQVSAEAAADLPDEFECEALGGVPETVGASAFDPSGLLGIWQAGAGAVRFPAGTGLPIEPGNVLVARMHYHPLGGTGTEKTAIELAFAPGPVEREARMVSLPDTGFVIPPETPVYQHEATFEAPSGGAIWGLAPFLRLRGSALSLQVDGQCALDVPRWQSHWQGFYWFAGGPLELAPGASIRVGCTWRNTTSELVLPGASANDEICAAVAYWVP